MRVIDLAVAEFAARQHGLFTREQAVARGATQAQVKVRVRQGLWVRRLRGVYQLAGHAKSWRQSVMAVCLYYNGWASHRTAGILKGLASMPRNRDIELIVPRAHRGARAGIKLYGLAESLRAADTEIVDGIPMTSTARTLFDLAAVIARDPLEEAVDDALNRRLVSPTRLKWQLEREARRGRAGIRVMRALLADRKITDAVHESPPETRFARIMRDLGIEVVSQFRIFDGDEEIARLDFAIPALGIAIEVDGFTVHGKRVRWERDVERGERVKMMGWDLVRFTARDTKRPDVVEDRIGAAIERAQVRLSAVLRNGVRTQGELTQYLETHPDQRL